MVKWSVDDIYDIKKDESVCNSCYSPILWVHVIWSKQLFIVICLVFLVSRFPWVIQKLRGSNLTQFWPLTPLSGKLWTFYLYSPRTSFFILRLGLQPMAEGWGNVCSFWLETLCQGQKTLRRTFVSWGKTVVFFNRREKKQFLQGKQMFFSEFFCPSHNVFQPEGYIFLGFHPLTYLP